MAAAALLAVAAAPEQTMPPNERALISISEDIANRQMAQIRATHVFEFSELVAERKRLLCEAITDMTVKDWRGVLLQAKLAKGEQDAGVEIMLSDDVKLTTHGQRVDVSVVRGLPSLNTGPTPSFHYSTFLPVIFDGALVPSRTDCIQEQGPSDDDSLRGPSFTLILTRIAPAPPVDLDGVSDLDVAHVQEMWHQELVDRSCIDPGLSRNGYAMDAQFGAALKRLPPAPRALAEAAKLQGGGAAWTDLQTGRDAACKLITPAIHERLTDMAMGLRSVLHD